jgi:hypothetical protein
MMLNTFEHGYSDALNGRQCVLGSDEYVKGYKVAVRQQKADRWLTLISALVLLAGLGAALAVSIARLAQDLVV